MADSDPQLCPPAGDKRVCLQDRWVFCPQCVGAFCLGSSLGSRLGSSSSPPIHGETRISLALLHFLFVFGVVVFL